MNARHVFLFATLAMNQTRFFEALGTALEEHGHQTAYLCFHERSHEYLARRGKQTFNAFREGSAAEAELDLSRYAWPSLNFVLSHEKTAFEVDDSAALTARLRRYLAATESALEALARRSSAPVTLVQELGGFVVNAAAFYAARHRGLDNVFIEPSFFRGRVFFVCNSFAARRVRGPMSAAVSPAVSAYLDEATAKQQVVIPIKDARHYRDPLRKLTDPYNLRRLGEKALDKYILGKREVFQHLGGHARRHARMWLNSRLLRGRYRGLPAADASYVYYPLHVPADVALTIRSPEYLDQLALVDYLARIVPHTHQVLIKEHPALIGALDRQRLLELLRTRDNVRLLDPATSNYDVIRGADAVITVNSKSGAEALLLQRPVLVLGDAFYSACDLVCRIDGLPQLPAALARVLTSQPRPEAAAVRRYFQDVWDASWPGELHVPDAGNGRVFAASLLGFLAGGLVSAQAALLARER